VYYINFTDTGGLIAGPGNSKKVTPEANSSPQVADQDPGRHKGIPDGTEEGASDIPTPTAISESRLGHVTLCAYK
jgi:hypothetical protein